MTLLGARVRCMCLLIALALSATIMLGACAGSMRWEHAAQQIRGQNTFMKIGCLFEKPDASTFACGSLLHHIMPRTSNYAAHRLLLMQQLHLKQHILFCMLLARALSACTAVYFLCQHHGQNAIFCLTHGARSKQEAVHTGTAWLTACKLLCNIDPIQCN